MIIFLISICPKCMIIYTCMYKCLYIEKTFTTVLQLWESMFEPLHCLNFGIGGDQTQNILWRLNNGELETLEPKVMSMLIQCSDRKEHLNLQLIIIIHIQGFSVQMLCMLTFIILLQVVVLLAGTNNYSNTAEEVTDGIMEIVSVIQSKLKSSHIIVMVTLHKLTSISVKSFCFQM